MSAVLDAWPFVVAAYAAAVGGTAILVAWSYFALRRAEARADALDRK
ncbi:MAG TPA: hypothetical protein VNT42_10765 [Sphingomonas sp.]|nr:hypothetical protein [Sphingomonas sp.]